jgi:hypothetical protein
MVENVNQKYGSREIDAKEEEAVLRYLIMMRGK